MSEQPFTWFIKHWIYVYTYALNVDVIALCVSYRMMAQTAAEATGIDPVLFANEVNNYISPTIESWKFAARREYSNSFVICFIICSSVLVLRHCVVCTQKPMHISVGSRLAGGMAGTAMFFLNGVDLSLNPSVRLSTDDWIAIIDPLLDELRKN